MDFLIVLAVLLVVVFVVSGPLRREWQARAARDAGPADPDGPDAASGRTVSGGPGGGSGRGALADAAARSERVGPADPVGRPPGSGGAVGDEERELAELEAAREAKYREIRDADLDHRTGKLSDADYEIVDGTLRAEAVEILHELDRLRGGVAGPGAAAPSGRSRDPAHSSDTPPDAPGPAGSPGSEG